MTPQNKEKFNKELKVARSRIREVQERYKGDNQFYLMIRLVENLVQVLHNNYRVFFFRIARLIIEFNPAFKLGLA